MPGQSESRPTHFAALIDAIVPPLFPSDAKLAEALGAPQSTVLGWRRGAKPSTKYVLKLSDLTGMDAGALLRIAEHKRED
jgi:hypothetical protein